MNELDLFSEALAQRDTHARAAFLDQHCLGKPQLRQRLDELLKAYRDPMVQEAVTVAESNSTALFTEKESNQLLGTVIAGRYKLQEVIGEGGMGTVFIAEQTEPVKRKVALKLIKRGMDSKNVLARFDAERQALAMMDHPNIARVMDGGMSLTGQPFFVMELIQGLPLIKFCDELKMTPRERLELFVPICQAIQHAHQKGIVHRDLKPANILVTRVDGRPVPKVIDFGVAKATGGKLTDQSLSTQYGAVVGTLEYMSPEQAGYSNQDVDTRSDIYSLGVILYELLTGLRPIDAKRLQSAALFEMIRIIVEDEPSKPSTRLSTDESLPSLAALRQTEPWRLMAMLRGELDWVVMKCLEKQRDRRYETANGLARDIQRYLADVPVEARPPTTGYVMKKFLQRHRGPVLAACLLALALVAGIVGTTIGYLRAEHAADQERVAKEIAVTEREKASQSAAQEKDAKEHEAQERKYAQAITQFVKDDFFALTSVEGQNLFGQKGNTKLSKDTTLLQLLNRAADKLDTRTDLDPRIEAELRWMIGFNLLHQGEFSKATKHLERCVSLRQQLLGPEHADVQNAQDSLAVSYRFLGEFNKALPLAEMLSKNVKARRGPDHPETLSMISNLAETYREAGRLDKALPLLEQNLRVTRTQLGADHPDTLICMNHLALCYRESDQLDKALPLYEDALKSQQVKIGKNDPSTLILMNNLAEAYRVNGQLTKALPLLKETLELTTATLGTDHPNALTAMNNLAIGYQSANQMDLAVPLYEETYRRTKARLGDKHPNTLISMNSLALAYQALGKSDKALPLLEESMKTARVTFGPDHPNTLVSMFNLARGYHTASQFDKAVPLFEETLQIRKAKLGRDHASTLSTMNGLANAYRGAGQMDKALPLYEETSSGLEKLQFQPGQSLAILGNTIAAYEAAGKFEAAEGWRRKKLSLLKAQPGVDSPASVVEMAELGMNLCSQRKWAEAETLLLKGYEGLKKLENAPGGEAARLVNQQCIVKTLDGLLQLYTETRKPEEVKKWQGEKDKLPKAP